jgi:hypothetical protein
VTFMKDVDVLNCLAKNRKSLIVDKVSLSANTNKSGLHKYNPKPYFGHQFSLSP